VIAGELCRQRIAEKGVEPFILGSAEAIMKAVSETFWITCVMARL
jgi:hypothetical protein